jgi:hypothetical protein
MCVLFLSVGGCDDHSNSTGSSHYPDQNLKAPNRLDQGVVLAWNREAPPADDKVNAVSVGQTLVVRVRNLDGWLIDKIKDGRLTGEPAMTPDDRFNYFLLQKLRGSDKVDDFLTKYETAAALGNRSSSTGVPPPSTGTPTATTTPSPLPPLPQGVTIKQLRDARNSFEGFLSHVKRQLFLIINNSQFRQIKAENPDAGVVTADVKAKQDDTVQEFDFRIRRRPGDEDAWNNLYDGTRAIHDVRVSLGVELDQKTFVLDTAVFPQADAKVQRMQLELFSEGWLWSTLAALAILLLVGIGLAASTPLLRDTDLPLRGDGWPQFSLSRVQLAFWTYLIIGAFLVIWLVTDRLDTLNATVLALLGISCATTFASKMANVLTLDGGMTSTEVRRAARRFRPIAELRTDLAAELAQLKEQAAAAAPAGPNPNPQLFVQLAARIERLRDDLDYLSHNRFTRFLIDLLGENGKVTLHRLQIIAWTIVLGIVFVSKVKRELSMPVFSDTLLGLMGLSSLTYVALKVPDLKKAQTDVAAAADPN